MITLNNLKECTESDDTFKLNNCLNICFRSDLAYFDGLNETIQSVCLVKTKPGKLMLIV